MRNFTRARCLRFLLLAHGASLCASLPAQNFLHDLAANSSAGTVNVIAHSLGNKLLILALKHCAIRTGCPN